MSILSRYLSRSFLSIFLLSMVFFTAILEIADIFQNMNRYISRDVPLAMVFHIQAMYAPQCIILSLPIATIFAVSFALGSLYANNELIAVFSSGISLLRFSLPLLCMAAILSVASLWFNESIVIDALQEKAVAMQDATGSSGVGSAQNVTLMDEKGRVVYQVDFFNGKNQTIQNMLVIQRDESFRIFSILRADRASWSEDHWILEKVDTYDFSRIDGDDADTDIKWIYQDQRDDRSLVLPPDAFRRKTVKIDELHLGDALELIEDTRQSGLPYRNMILDLQERFSYSLTPLVVAFLSASIGSQFRKNILLLSLLFSLLLSVSYYVIQMVAGLLANFNIVSPEAGAWLGISLYGLIGIISFTRARN